MFEITAQCILSGDSFSPAALEQKTGLCFQKKNEAGEIGSLGRYKGKSIPYGHANIIISGNNDSVIYSAVEILEKNILEFKKSNAEKIILHLAINYSKQCNLEFDPDLLSRISALCVPLTITCVNVDD